MAITDEFIQLTNTDRKTAKHFLKLAKNDLEAAVNLFFSEDLEKASCIFDAYAQGDMIDVDGTERLLQDLGIDGNDAIFISFSYFLKSPSMCEFERTQFLRGCKELGVTNLDELKQSLQKMRNALDDKAQFKQIYLFTFNFAKNQNQKTLGNLGLI
jgi:DCN1-like protein 1/2